MIRKVEVENFKTLKNLSIELGRINVIIGENGSGKSNLTESIAFGIAGLKDKLENEYLSARGIRMTHPRFMKSALQSNSIDVIKFTIELDNGKAATAILSNEGKPYSKWENLGLIPVQEHANKLIRYLLSLDNKPVLDKEDAYSDEVEDLRKQISSIEFPEEQAEEFLSSEYLHSLSKRAMANEVSEISDFVIYRPEESHLRRYDRQGQIEPLGRQGEGLLKLLTVFASEREDALNEVKKHLRLLDWFEDLNLKDEFFEKEVYFDIKDKYVDTELGYFDQRSSNEGFLFLAFYISLFVSSTAPNHFAIENIDNSLNPKLCSELIKTLVVLAKKHDKQAILSTHNPAVLDGLDLSDDEQRLFVISRNRDGSTKVKRVKMKPSNSERKMKLSEMYMSGMLGGLPKNF